MEVIAQGCFKVSLEKEKACLRIRTLQSRKQQEKEKFRRQNFNYQMYGPLVFQKHPNTSTLTPSVADVEDFWRGIVGVEGSYDLEDPDVKKWRTSTVNIALDVDDFILSDDRWKRVLNKTRAWKAPGPDGICAFWYKKLPKVSMILKVLVQDMINGCCETPSWLVQGRTVLIPKDGCLGEPEKYRPIACLNTGYKALTAVITGVVYSPC